MSKPSDRLRAALWMFTLLALGGLAIRGTAKWPTVDEAPQVRISSAAPADAPAESDDPVRQEALDEAEASMLLGKQVLDQFGFRDGDREAGASLAAPPARIFSGDCWQPQLRRHWICRASE
jgi:hypothetical protein